MSGVLSLQPAGPLDLPGIAAIWRAAWASANPGVAQVQPPARWQARAEAEFGPPSEAVVVWRGAERVAFFVVDPALRYLHQLFVAPAAQGAGLGASLLQQIDQRLAQGWSLHVAESNAGARRFYERQGLVAGVASQHPVTGRLRVEYRRLPRCAAPAGAERRTP